MKRFIWLLVGLLAVRLALMALVPVFESSEARYAAISANMARTGDFVVPRFTCENVYQTFDGKPPLVFQAGGLVIKGLSALKVNASKVFGVREGTELGVYGLQFAVRVFPLLSALLLLMILYHAVCVLADGERARLAVFIAASCTAFYAAAGIAMTDMTLTCCVAGALLLYECLLRVAPGAWRPALLYRLGIAALLGTGMITKGPVALVLFGLPVLVDAIVNRHWKYVFAGQWLVAAPVFLLIAVPWFVLIEQRNPGAVWYFFYNENFLRFISHEYGDKYGAGREAFRGVSILWALVVTLPWVLLPLWETVRRAFKRAKGPWEFKPWIRDTSCLAVLAIVGFWCLTSRVLLSYLIPVTPLFAAELARRGNVSVLRRLAPWCAGASALVLVAGLLGGMFFSDKMQGANTPFDVCQDHYANEFYHGTKSADEIARLKKKHDAEVAEMIAKWQAWRRQREEEARRKAAEKKNATAK